MSLRRATDALTLRGRCFLAAGIALMVCGIVLGFNDITRAGLLVAALPIAVLLIAGTRQLTLTTRRDVAPVVIPVDQPCDVGLFIDNPGSRATAIVLAEEHLDYALGDRPRFVIPRMGPGESHQLHYRVRSSVRGRHRLGPLALRIKDPFDLTTRHAVVPGVGELIVLPRVVELRSTRVTGGLGNEGTIPHMIALHGEDDVSVREYRDGDDLRRIHWPATARTGDLMVRQEDRPAARRAVVFFDDRGRIDGVTRTSGSFEWGVTAAASVLALIIPSGVTTQLVLDGRSIAGLTGEALSLDQALVELAVVEPADEAVLPVSTEIAVETAAGGALVIAVICAMTDAEADLLSRIRPAGSAGLALVQNVGDTVSQAGATAARLRDRGWSAVAVDAGMSVAEAWAAVEAGMRANR